MKQSFSIQEAAKFLGISRMSVYRLIKRGLLNPLTDPLNLRVKLIPYQELLTIKNASKNARRGVKVA